MLNALKCTCYFTLMIGGIAASYFATIFELETIRNLYEGHPRFDAYARVMAASALAVVMTGSHGIWEKKALEKPKISRWALFSVIVWSLIGLMQLYYVDKYWAYWQRH